jgi:hypothetical protein
MAFKSQGVFRLPPTELLWQCVIDERGECPAHEGRNIWIYEAARGCAHYKIEPRKAADLIRAALTRNEKGNEVEHAIRNAYSKRGEKFSSVHSPSATKAVYDPAVLTAAAAVVDADITDDWLRERSPRSTDSRPVEFLDAVFQPGDSIFLGNSKHAKTGWLYRPWDSNESELNDWLSQNEIGCWFVTNPVDGLWRDRSGNAVDSDIVKIDDRSRRSTNNISAFRHFLLESDLAPRELWLKWIVQLRNVVAIYESGNESVHALMSMPCVDKAEFDQKAAQAKIKLVPFGACVGSMKAAQFSRLPNVVRNDNGNRQRLLYLAGASASKQSIWEKEEADQPLTDRL